MNATGTRSMVRSNPSLPPLYFRSNIAHSVPPTISCMSFLRRSAGWLPFRTLDLYIARQILMSTFIAVAVLSVILVLGQIFRKLLDLLASDALPMDQLLAMVWNMFAFTLSYTVPWGILTSVLLVFGRMSADNELTSMRMAGLSLMRICWPVLLVAGALSLLCFYINIQIAPDASKQLKSQRYEFALNDPVKLFEAQQVIDVIPGYIMYCESKEGNHLKNFVGVQLTDTEPPEPGPITMAKDVEIVPNRELRRVEMVYTDFQLFTYDYEKVPDPNDPTIIRRGAMDVKGPVSTTNSPLPADLSKFWEKANRPRVDGMSLGELKEVFRDSQFDPALRQTPASEQARGWLEGMKNDQDRKKLRTESLTEYNSRFSRSLACLTLTLVGICFGISAQRRETSAGFVLSLIVGILYFAFIMLGAVWKDKAEYYPQYWVWLPNVLFGAIGLVLFWRHQRR